MSETKSFRLTQCVCITLFRFFSSFLSFHLSTCIALNRVLWINPWLYENGCHAFGFIKCRCRANRAHVWSGSNCVYINIFYGQKWCCRFYVKRRRYFVASIKQLRFSHIPGPVLIEFWLRLMAIHKNFVPRASAGSKKFHPEQESMF